MNFCKARAFVVTEALALAAYELFRGLGIRV